MGKAEMTSFFKNGNQLDNYSRRNLDAISPRLKIQGIKSLMFCPKLLIRSMMSKIFPKEGGCPSFGF